MADTLGIILSILRIVFNRTVDPEITRRAYTGTIDIGSVSITNPRILIVTDMLENGTIKALSHILDVVFSKTFSPDKSLRKKFLKIQHLRFETGPFVESKIGSR